MYKVCNEVPKLVSAVNPSVPSAFDPIVAKALDKSPAKRYASAEEFRQALRPADSHKAPPGTWTSLPGPIDPGY
jgi:eukaryotic-like serine/threonine-protein kinase